MRNGLKALLAGTIAIGLGAQPGWAHPSAGFHVHADAIAGVVVVSLVVGLLALTRQPRKDH